MGTSEFTADIDAIVTILMDCFGFSKISAQSQYRKRKYDLIPLETLKTRLLALSTCFGTITGEMVLERHPSLVQNHPIERLPHHMRVLMEDGLSLRDVQRLLVNRLDLSQLTEAEFANRLAAIHSILPDAAQRHELIKAHKDVFAYTVEDIAWRASIPFEASVHDYWDRFTAMDKVALPEPKALSIVASEERLLINEVYRTLEASQHKKAPDRDIRIAARRFVETYSNHTQDEISKLTAAGWSSDDIIRLGRHKQNKTWRNRLEKTLASERVLLEAGLTPDQARTLVIIHSLFSENDAGTIPATFTLLSQLLEPAIALRAIMLRPKILFHSEEDIRVWHRHVTNRQLAPLKLLHRLGIIKRLHAVATPESPEAPMAPKEPRATPPSQRQRQVVEKAIERVVTPAAIAEVIPFTARDPDEDVRITAPAVKRAEQRMGAEDYHSAVKQAAQVFSGRAIGMSADVANTFVLYRPELVLHYKRILPMVQFLTAVGYKDQSLYDVVLHYTGVLLLDASTLGHLVQYARATKRAPPSNPQEMLIPLDVFLSRTSQLERRGFSSRNSHYHTALFARTNREFEKHLEALASSVS